MKDQEGSYCEVLKFVSECQVNGYKLHGTTSSFQDPTTSRRKQMFSTDGGHLERSDVTESDMKIKIQLFNQGAAADLERKILRGKASAEASIDPSRTFHPLPSFLNESFNLELTSFAQRLSIILRSVPTSDANQSTRKLQSEGHSKIASHLRSLLQQEEAQNIMKRPQSRGVTVSSSRPNTPAGAQTSMTLQHNTRANINRLATELYQNPSARNILIENKPRPTERDREHVISKVSRWPSPRRSNKFLNLIDIMIQSFFERVNISIEEKAWYSEIVAHQEERKMHAEGDRMTLVETIKDFRKVRKEHFKKLDHTTRELTKQVRSARSAIQLETDFEHNIHQAWEDERTTMLNEFVEKTTSESKKLFLSTESVMENHMNEMTKICKKKRRDELEMEEKNNIYNITMKSKDKEIEEIKRSLATMQVNIQQLKKEIQDKEMAAQRMREIEDEVEAAANERIAQYAAEDAEKQRILDEELAALKVVQDAEEEANKKKEEEEGGTKKGKGKKKTKK